MVEVIYNFSERISLVSGHFGRGQSDALKLKSFSWNISYGLEEAHDDLLSFCC